VIGNRNSARKISTSTLIGSLRAAHVTRLSASSRFESAFQPDSIQLTLLETGTCNRVTTEQSFSRAMSQSTMDSTATTTGTAALSNAAAAITTATATPNPPATTLTATATASIPSQSWYQRLSKALVILLQITGIAFTITFGVWAVLSYRLAQKESCRTHPVSASINP
jgi:hypothetical protein